METEEGETSDEEKKPFISENTRIYWKSNVRFIYFLLSSSMDMNNVFIFGHILNKNDIICPVTIYLIAYILCAMPLMYMIQFVAHYTALDLLQMRLLCPLFRGLSTMCVLNTMGVIIWNSIMLTEFAVYILSSFQKNLPWLMCPKEATNCWSSEMECENCLLGEKVISALYYRNEKYLINANNWGNFGRVPVLRISILGSLWISILLILRCSESRLRKCFGICLILFIILGCLMLPLIDNWTSHVGLLFRDKQKDYTEWLNWSTAIYTVVFITGAGRPVISLFAAYLPPSSKPEVYNVIVIFLHIIMTLLMNVVAHIQISAVFEATKTNNEDDFIKIVRNTDYIHLTYILQGIGLNHNYNLLTILYLLSNFVITYQNVGGYAAALIGSLMLRFPILRTYKLYLVTSFLIFYFVADVILLPRSQNSSELLIYFKEGIRLSEVITSFLLVIVYVVIYSLRKLTDDIYYSTGSQPNKFWQFSWLLLPFYLAVAFHRASFILKQSQGNNRVMIITVTTFCVAPLIISAIYELFHYIKKKHVIGMLLPKERWGPEDPEERKLRRLYNPRTETKARRRRQTCKHECLIYNTKLAEVLEMEHNFWLEQGFDRDVILNLSKHVKNNN